jgi:hypothetical protein
MAARVLTRFITAIELIAAPAAMPAARFRSRRMVAAVRIIGVASHPAMKLAIQTRKRKPTESSNANLNTSHAMEFYP